MKFLGLKISRVRAASAPPAAPQSSLSNLPSYMLDGSAPSLMEDRISADTRRRLTPNITQLTLRGASMGEPKDIWDLHNIMIRSWTRLGANIGTIRRAVACAPWSTTPWTDPNGDVPPEAARRKRVVDAALFNMRPRAGHLEGDWETFVGNAAENCLRGTGVSELLWHTHDSGDGPVHGLRAVRSTHPSYYAWTNTGHTAPGTRNEDRLLYRPRPTAGTRGALTEWPADQFVVQLAAGWNDHPAMAGILGLLAIPWIGANFAPQWLYTYAENFGIPLVWANYPTGDDKSRDAVYNMLRNFAGRRYGAFPTGAVVNLLESSKSSGDLPQMALMEWADTLCDIVLLGQTLTSDTKGVGSQALGKVHEGVKYDLLESLASEVCKAANRQILPAICRLNFGDDQFMPTLTHGLKEPEDEKAKAETDAIHITNGVRFTKKDYYQRHGIIMPNDGDELLEPPASPAAPASGQDPNQDPAKPGAKATVKAAQASPPPDAQALADAAEVETEMLSEVFTKIITGAVAEGLNRQPDISNC